MPATGDEAKAAFEAGLANREAEQLDQAIGDFVRARGMLEEMGMKDSLFYARVIGHLGEAMAAKGKSGEGLALVREAKVSYEGHGMGEGQEYEWLSGKLAAIESGQLGRPQLKEEPPPGSLAAKAKAERPPDDSPNEEAELLRAGAAGEEVEDKPDEEASILAAGAQGKSGGATAKGGPQEAGPAEKPGELKEGEQPKFRRAGMYSESGGSLNEAELKSKGLDAASLPRMSSKAPGVFSFSLRWLMGVIVVLTFYLGLRCAKGEKGYLLDVEDPVIEMKVQSIKDVQRMIELRVSMKNRSTAFIDLLKIRVELLDKAGNEIGGAILEADGIKPGGPMLRVVTLTGRASDVVAWRNRIVYIQIRVRKGAPVVIAKALEIFKLAPAEDDYTLDWVEDGPAEE